MSGGSTTRVLASGLALGEIEPRTYGVSCGGSVQRLSEGEWEVWLLACGAWSQDGRWGRDEIAQAAAEAQVVGFDECYASLQRRRLLIEVDVDGAWADGVTFQPLLSGQGKLPGDAGFSLGVLGAPPMIELDAAAYDAWRWLPLGGSIRAAAQALGLAAGPLGWDAVADRVAGLIARGAGHLQPTEDSA